MKIVRSLRVAYAEQYDKNSSLQRKFVSLIESRIKTRWHFEDRLKSEEGFALKIQTGRFEPNKLEDFYACTIVVENSNSIKEAVELVGSICEILRRKPLSDKFTHKSPEHFPFDDLRLYVRLKEDAALPPSSSDGIVFEVQIKTYLQHAWAIATHDLVYKSDSVSWPLQRIAYQAKAVLESAETTIGSSKLLARESTLDKKDKNTKKLEDTIIFIKRNWDPSLLPFDVTRLGGTLCDLIQATELNIIELQKCIDLETKVGRGMNISNLPPYLIIIQSLITSGNEKLKAYFTNSKSTTNKFRVLITPEITIPIDYPKILEKNVLRC